MQAEDSFDQIILVDESDRPIGFERKLRAHEDGGKLHRAFSIFIFDDSGRMLLQKRAMRKYHFAGLWTNACCSHPRKGEKLPEVAHVRLREEFGFDTTLRKAFEFTYRATDPTSGLTEHEFDHVYVGVFNGEPRPNPEEIDEWRWVEADELRAWVRKHAGEFTPWFKVAAKRVLRSR